jgi:hypothetical protein
MEYTFLLSLVSIDYTTNNIQDEKKQILEKLIQEIKLLQQRDKYFPKIGITEKTLTNGYGYGEQEYLAALLITLSKRFPNVTLAFYHIFWNGECLSIYTLYRGNIIKNECESEPIKLGFYSVKPIFDPNKLEIQENITKYFK